MEKENKSRQNTNRPLVAVCVPVYNGDKFIIEALESIRNQTYDNFECHVVNNASTDRTEELVREFVKKDKRFNLHTHTDFVDLTGNWNRTVAYIPQKAKYYKLVQADDVIFPDSIETHVEMLEKHPNVGIGSSYRLVGTTVYGKGMDYFKGEIRNGEEILLKHLNEEIEITGSVTQLFFRTELLNKVPGYPEIFIPDDIHMDTRLAYEMFLISDLAFSFKILNYTRRHADAGTVTTVEKYNTLIHAKEARLKRFTEVYPELDNRYSRVRRHYAYFLFKARLRNEKDCLKWHKEHLKRRIRLSEYLSGIFWENRFGARLSRMIEH
jgi:glycosyltransferase involved in cell wall biosynthesis